MAEPGAFTGLRGEWRREEPMAKHTSWRTGGRADRAYLPADSDDFAACLRMLPAAEPVLVTGLGSNLLVRDGGFRGTVIVTHAAGLRPALDGGRIHAAAGVASPKLARFAASHGRCGAEFLAGVPGTVGGALAMNAGCYGAETWQVVDEALVVRRSGELRRLPKSAFEIGYRHCALPGATLGEDAWFAAAWFALPHGDAARSRARIRALLERRVATQPLALPNAGSVFRNPPGDHAARLIEAAGLKGLARGGARVSKQHANFIVNPKGAGRAADIEWLIDRVRATVRERFGVDLQPEVRIVGDPA